MASILGREKEAAIRRVLRSVSGIDGAAAECGVYRGGCLRLIAAECPGRQIYGFDTFAGLPAEMWSEGEPHSVGDFGDCSLEAVAAGVADLESVRLVRGNFPASAGGLEGERFAFVQLDFDFYESTRAAREWLLPRMSPGAAIVFDDYEWKHCPGVKRAIDEFGLGVQKTVPFQAVWMNR